MAALLDTTATQTAANTAASTVCNITIASNSDRGLLIKIGWRQTGVNISSVTSSAGTPAAVGTVITSGNRKSAIYKLIAPTAGAQSVTVAWSDTYAADVIVDVESWYAADQTNFVSDFTSATGTGTAPSVTVTNAATGDVISDFVLHNSGGTSTAGANQTENAGADLPASGAYAASYQAGADGGVMDWTMQFSDSWAALGVRILEVSGAAVTKTPSQAVLTFNVLAPLTNAYTFIAIQDTLINESGQPVANAANIRLLVWYSGQAIGAPDYSVNGQTSNASGSISWSVTPGGVANGQAIFYVAQDSISYSNYTCGRVVPTYG